MPSTPRKRPASRSPEGGRLAKRQLTSSPEEGEVDDTPTVVSHPTILPIALPAKPLGGQTKKTVPFPFKKKVEATKEGGDAKEDSQDAPQLNVFTRFEEDAKKAREEPRRNNHRPRPGMKHDHWEPSGPSRGPLRDSPPSLLSRLGPPSGASSAMSYPSRDDRDRDRRRSPRRSPLRSRSPTPHSSLYDRDRHRLPPARSPPLPSNFSPPSYAAADNGRDHSRERGYDRDRSRDWDRDRDRWDGDPRRHNRRGSPSDHRYRPDYRRVEEREWTRRENSYYPDNRRRADDRRDRRPGYDSYRPSSPRPPASSIPVVPSTLVSPPSLSAPSEPPRSPPPSISISEPPPSPPLPPSPKPASEIAPKPPSDNCPRPPSSTPPPAPPPDVRLIKDAQLPPTHAQVKITLSRPPEAPRNVHSPLSLELPPAPSAKAMERGPERKGPPPSQGFPPPPRQNNQLGVPQKVPEPPAIRMLRRKLPLRRPPKVELKAYGHGFAGCGQQSDYEATTKLGEGTFGCAFFLGFSF